ncbi:MAG: DUF882 domain-containing protein [Elusimicrobiaceae bacterium]|nr:DUF882 domain-containing protein [Elusimicrobiaceae bacterium]
MKNFVSGDFKMRNLIVDDFKLSPHFTFFELTKTANSGFLNQNRAEALKYLKPLKHLATDILEPIRAKFKKPIIITSGFRCYGLNKSLGSSNTSQHLKGEAADFFIKGIAHNKVVKFLVEDLGFNFGQLILENEGNSSWIHISLGTPFRTENKCRQIIKLNKKSFYEDNKQQNFTDTK